MKSNSYFQRHPIIKHLLIISITSIFLLVVISLSLNYYTLHNKTITVPDFSGKTTVEVRELTKKNRLDFVINDSVYSNEKEKGTIIMQEPPTGSKVKRNRKIYLTIVANSSEQISVPNLVDLTLRQALSILETYGFRVGKLEYIQSEYKNAVLSQKHRGRNISPETMLPRGSVIDLVLGDGMKTENISVPFLIGKRKNEATKMIYNLSLNVGKEVFIDCADTSEARVFRQSPSSAEKSILKPGDKIDLWYKSNKKFDFNKHLKNIKKDTAYKY
ncbi:MAG: PASTA domain-containing protein [Bacteroidales bacterium]|nr:PASTA domain-containing protein [Bacteroidales bacterium]